MTIDSREERYSRFVTSKLYQGRSDIRNLQQYCTTPSPDVAHSSRGRRRRRRSHALCIGRVHWT
eukprot:scaffold46760_cov39-Phaeocystis_antarctica.AAC.2